MTFQISINNNITSLKVRNDSQMTQPIEILMGTDILDTYTYHLFKLDLNFYIILCVHVYALKQSLLVEIPASNKGIMQEQNLPKLMSKSVQLFKGKSFFGYDMR